jgi:hypothetical protein
VADKRLNVKIFHFQEIKPANYEGYFIMDSADLRLAEIKKEMNRGAIELPKYQLLITTAEGIANQVRDCWIDKLEFEKNKYESTKCYFFSNDVSTIESTS